MRQVRKSRCYDRPMKSRLRFTIALTVAAVLGGALLYFSIGGALETYVSPGGLLKSPPGQTYKLDAIVSQQPLRDPQDAAYSAAGLRFWVQDKENAKIRVLVVYTGAVPDAFKATREVVMQGKREGQTFVADPGTMITKCPSKFQNQPDPPAPATKKS
jgi:cytochrome c-type biogenesis protein CcmE